MHSSTQSHSQPLFLRMMQSVGSTIGAMWRRAGVAISNARRRLFHSHLADYVVIELVGALEERTPDTPWWYSFLPGYRPALSLENIDAALSAIAVDPDVTGVVFLFRGVELRLTQAQSFIACVDRFRARDKELHAASGRPAKQVIAYLEQIDQVSYVAACAADRILAAPLATWDVLGVQVSSAYFKETLARWGLAADVVKISPWKSAADALSEASMSHEVRAQTNWLLDSVYGDIVSAIARGRNLDEDDVRAVIDTAPLSAVEAMNCGMINDTCYEDELPTNLGERDQPVTLKPYHRVRKLLWRRMEPRVAPRIGVIDLIGAIVPGESRSFPIELPLLGGAMLGSTSVQRAVRAARKDDRLAAVIAYVDSPGGSALASDLMWRELSLLAQEKPLIIYMGAVAASGGYYISTPARTVVAQRATITGSIGVVTAKLVSSAAYEKLAARRVVMQRGANADLYADHRAWDAEQRAVVEESVRSIYFEFTSRVSSGRKMSSQELEPICRGRVWTGAQAKERGLVDELGDFHTAYQAACRALALPDDGRVRIERVDDPGSGLMTETVKSMKTLLGLDRAALLEDAARLVLHGDLESIWRGERVWLLADDLPAI
jgi:protease-4